MIIYFLGWLRGMRRGGQPKPVLYPESRPSPENDLGAIIREMEAEKRARPNQRD